MTAAGTTRSRRNGYAFVVGGPSVGVGKPGKIAYFPVYPLLMRYASRLFGTSPEHVYYGGILVSWVAFVLAMVLLLKIAMLDVDEEQAERAVYLAAIFPVRVLLRRRLHRGDVPVAGARGLLSVPSAVVDPGRRVRRPRVGDAGQRHPHSARAGVDCLAPRRTEHQRPVARGVRPRAGRVRDRRVLRLRLHAGGQPVRVGIGDQALGLLPGRRAVARARASGARTGHAPARCT